MVDVPDEELQFMQEARLIFDQAATLAEGAKDQAMACAAALAIIVKGVRRTPHNVRLEWDIDPEQFVADALTQARIFSLRVKKNIQIYGEQPPEEGEISVEDAVGVMIQIFSDWRFAEFFKMFMGHMLAEKGMLEEKFMREWD